MSGSRLVAKDITFNGSTIKAVQDTHSIIWVGISCICNGIGFNKSQKDLQIQKIQKDKVLKEGCLKFQAGVFEQNNPALAIQLDYLPLWLCKINITDKMESENPELAKKIRLYQLKAKDVLADAFIYRKEVMQNDLEKAITQIVDKRFRELMEAYIRDNKYSDQKRIIPEIPKNQEQKQLPAQSALNQEQKVISVPLKKERKIQYTEEFLTWRQNVNELCDQLVMNSSNYLDRNDVLKKMYILMNRTYGYVKEQYTKEYKRDHQADKTPCSLGVLYEAENGKFRNIFFNNLQDLVTETCGDGNKDQTIQCLEELAGKLAVKNQDISIHYVNTWKNIAKHMEEVHNVNWDNRITRYKNKTGYKRKLEPRKKHVIASSVSLMQIFKLSVSELLEEKL